MSVFVDTSALIVFLDEDDPEHGSCRDAWKRGLDEGEGFVTTNYVVVEALVVAQRRWGLRGVEWLVERFLPLVDVLWVGQEEHELAVTALLTAKRRQLSLVDCVSFACMRRQGIREYLALDPHFSQQGFTAYAAS